MADLNARIKPKKSSTAGEVPQAADLEVSEIAVNTADGKLFVKHTDNSIKEISGGTDIATESIDALSDVDTTTAAPTDGQVLTWVNANSQWEPADAAGGGATSIDDLSDVDTSTTAPSIGQYLYWDGQGWIPKNLSGPAGVAEQTGNLTTYPLHGIDGFYANQAALEADGFTFIASSQDNDDAGISFNPGAQWDGISFLGYTPTSQNWFISTNGGVGFDQGGDKISTLSGDAATNSSNIDLYVSLWSQDTATRLAGFKTIQDGGEDWLVVRIDFKVPYNSASNGFPVEVWFSESGYISVRYGTSVGGATFTVAGTANLIASQGVIVPGTSAPFTSLTANGAWSIVYEAGTPSDLALRDLADVGLGGSPVSQWSVLMYTTANGWVSALPSQALAGDYFFSGNVTAPTSGQILEWDPTQFLFVPVDYISKTTLKAEVAASVSFADFQARIAAL
jgi:hypothetical protein